MIHRPLKSLSLAALLALGGLGAPAVAGELAVYANGEELATEGFTAPELTRDGWQLTFDSIIVTVSGIVAMQTEPPFDPAAGGEPSSAVSAPLPMPEPLTIDLTDTDEDGRVLIGAVGAPPPGHYNAISWSVVPAPAGEWAGHSIVFVGTAMRGDETVDFVLTSADRHDYVCGEYVGDERKGFVIGDGGADLELTFHLDHVFGRQDKPADDPMNVDALGFDAFAGGGTQAISLAGLHVGHVGEGHCAVTFR